MIDLSYNACETETTVLNGKCSNTTCIYKISPESKNPRFSLKTPEPQIKQKNPRSSEKSLAMVTLGYPKWIPRSVTLAALYHTFQWM